MKEIKQKRLNILIQVDTLSKKCNCSSQEERNDCPNCIEMARLGLELDQLKSQERAKKNMTKGIKILTPQRKNARDALKMTIDEYIEFKRLQLSDSEIGKIKNVSRSAIGYWRKRNAEQL